MKNWGGVGTYLINFPPKYDIPHRVNKPFLYRFYNGFLGVYILAWGFTRVGSVTPNSEDPSSLKINDIRVDSPG